MGSGHHLRHFLSGVLLFTIIRTALPAFTQTMIRLEVTLYPQEIDPTGTRDPQTLSSADYQKLVRDALDDLFPEVTDRRQRRELMGLLSPGATYFVREKVMADPSLIGKRVSVLVPFSDDLDQLAKGRISAEGLEAERRVSDKQIEWFRRLEQRGMVEHVFNKTLFTAATSFAGAGRHLGRAGRDVLDDADHHRHRLPAAAPPSTWRSSRRKPLDGVDRSEHQQSRRRPLDRLRGLLGLAVFINFFGLPRSTRWSAAWCCR